MKSYFLKLVKARGAGMAAATHGRKTSFPSAKALKNAAREREAKEEIKAGRIDYDEYADY